jgi:hypothetical protein
MLLQHICVQQSGEEGAAMHLFDLASLLGMACWYAEEQDAFCRVWLCATHIVGNYLLIQVLAC